MSESPKQGLKLPPEQQAIRDKCFHPTGNFIEFQKQEIEQSIPERYENIVRAYPHRLAVTTKPESLTYEALNQMANRVARAIIAVRGQGNEPVAMLLDHGVSLIAAILGVLKSGKIYVSLEPFHASARTGYILGDTGTRLIVTSNRSFSEAKDLAPTGCQILNINEIDSSLSPENMGLSIPPDALASIMYTSGSTGSPKGVVQNHRNVLHSCKSYTNGFHISMEDRLSLLHSCSFNGSAYNLFGALLNGAALFPLDVRQEGVHQLVDWLGQNDITIYHSSPITFRHALQDLPAGERIPSLRIIHLSGAAVSNADVEFYKNYCSPNCILVHRMGVTETGTIRWYFIDKTTAMGGTRVPIGYPADHKEALILDDSGEEICDNRTGEIAIKSRYLSLGYWRKPHLTKAKFLPNPNGGERRIYLTGDLGRMAPDGCLFHLGRNDYRVKVRGFSVGVGEIESALLEHRGIQDAVVVGRESRFGDKRLVAYLVQAELRAITVTELRDFLKDRLPDYMIPSTFVILSELPLTPNGKVNRTALPAPEDKRPNLATPFAEPRTPIEGELARIWAGILSLDRVGIHDNFFDLGGHSLAATRVVSQIIKRFQLEVPLQSLFESPTVAEVAAVITKHHESTRAMKNEEPAGATVCSPGATPRNRALPLSFAQQRLWFLNQLEPDSAVYNVRKALRLRGRLNREALQKALDTIVERHEVLRTTFSSVDGKPIQIIHEGGNVQPELTAIDLMGYPDEQREKELGRFLSDFTHRPFDLEKDWPLCGALIRWAAEEHVLLVVMHHIASDGWSSDILFRELSALYEAFCQGKGSPLTDLPIQYADYAVWQKEWLEGEDLQQQLSYWKRQLKDVSPLELPTDHPRPAVVGHLGQTKTFRFPPALARGLKDLSRQANTTLFMTLLAAFQTLLHRYTGQDDIVVGSPIAGRNRVEVEGLIGFFVNTLVLRNDLSGNPTFRELLARVGKNALDAYSHQDAPFEKLVEELQPQRDLSRNPFFQVMFQLRNYPTQSVSLRDVSIEEYEFGSDIAKFDLSVGLRDDVTGLTGSVEYRTDLFDRTTIERMTSHFQKLLEGVVANPEQRISELPLITESERRQLLVEWNDTKNDYPKDKCIHELFEAQVEKTPDAIAVVFEDQRLTYRELNNRANQLAHYLIKLGVGPEVLAGIGMERSIEMIVGLLGILKAGGAYVPIDPSYPKDRREFILNDSQVSVLITKRGFGEESGSRMDDKDTRSVILDPRIKSVRFDRDGPVIEQESRENLTVRVKPGDIAYVIYTSGSTGTPKGVAIEHRNTGAFLSWVQSAFTQDELSGVLASTSICFDLSVFEIFAPLSSGGTVIVGQNALALATLPKQSTVTLLNTVPSAMNELLNLVAIPESVRVINLAGEPLRTDLVRRIYESASVRKVHDLYGPSECTTYSTWTCRTPDGPQTIGRPIANTRAYILDGSLNPVPIGIVGEIYIGGDGVARGYLNRPELTGEKFIADPFSEEPEARLYKTGDLARYLPDGNIEFLGRIDHQVKIRGYRIELGEIEATLRQHPSTRESIVLAREDSPGDRRLVAYVVAAPSSAPSANELRSFLQQKLAEYMVPSAFVMLDSLPLTPNGKLDRKALPAPDQTRPELDEAYTPPRTPVEELLAQIWSDVLQLDQVGIHDNFFALGGDSLRAIQIIARLRNILNKEVFLSDIFSNRTIAELANILDQRSADAEALSTAPIQPIGRNRHLPLSFSQERAWFIQQLHPSNLAYHFQSLLYFTGRLDVDALERSLSEIVRRHESFRTTFPDIDGNPVQLIHTPFSVSLPVVDLQELPDHERETALHQRIAEETQKAFDLAKLPLVRWILVKLRPDDFALIHVENHLVHDGWSFNVFRRELLELYKAFSTGDASPLPEPTLQFADFAHWQRQWMKGENAKRQLLYWKRQLTGSPSTLTLATDFPRPPVPSFRGAAVRFDIPPALGDSLRALSRERGVTLFMTMFSAFIALLYRYTQQDDICVGTGVGNRRWKESEELIGMLVNNVVLRTHVAGNPKFLDLLAQVRAVTLDTYANEDIPFDHVVRALEIKRDDSRNPVFQVMFSFHDAPLHEPSLPGISFKCVEAISNGSAKFDMNVIVMPHSEQSFAGRGGENVMTLVWEYSSDLFEPDTIERMVGHFQSLLEGIAANPEQRISELPLITESERRQLLVEWNDTKNDYPKDKCIHELFEAQVEKTPDAIAVVFEDQRLTYRELNRRANQLAHYLRELGVGPEVLVGVCVERSMEMIVGILGILKAGGAYVPLDPAYPRDRILFILRDTQAAVLLTELRLIDAVLGDLSENDQVGNEQTSTHDLRLKVICLDKHQGEISEESDENIREPAVAKNLAYVIYTSGSTGSPKGVMIEHRSAAAFLDWAHGVFTREDFAGVVASTSICFDLSMFEIFAPLTAGGSVILVENALALAHLDSAVTPTLVNTVPSVMAELLRLGGLPRSIRTVNLAGEPLKTSLVLQIGQETSAQQVYDLYGPSETTTYSTYTQRTADGIQTIGRPIANTQVYILDSYSNPAPIGIPGEIYIGGAGLARGYLNRPGLTAEKFIANPFSTEPRARLYKTGDLARYLPDGNIEFIGRGDNQVKIRGFRIELGEIEAVLGQHRAVQSSVVVVREDASGDKRLVGYVVARPERSFDAAEIKKHLKQKLPEYMIPSAFVLLDELPLTPNGKVDRRALPVPARNRPELEEVYQAPRTPLEDTLARIWAELLKADKVGIRDNFFELGGHSLLATQVISRIRSAFSVEVPLRCLFESPTIEQMAAVIMGAFAVREGEAGVHVGRIGVALERRGTASPGRRNHVKERRKSK